jgi:hypothetical protein
MSLKNILLVEGEADRGFFEAICRMLSITADVVNVATPKDSGGAHNTKEGVLSHLVSALLPQLQDGQLERIGVVVDADQLAHGSGYAKTLQRFTEALAQSGYHHNPAVVAGLAFAHQDGLADLGLWIMPNNADEGMLEDWIKQCLHPGEGPLYQHAELSIDAIPGGPKFQPLHRSKAEVATWLAWQKKPEHGLYNAAQPDLLNTSAPLFAEMHAWLKHVFAA